mmetsp:Transcript_63303/g.125110  ORF Transcript_63303/g.125110 Transcript_63303/m.125110 type:complete len:279 (-) Transcript_63303:1023-1859(-)
MCARAQRELRQRGGDDRGEKVVAPHNEAAQLGRNRFRRPRLSTAFLERRLVAVRAVREHDGPPLGGRRRRRRGGAVIFSGRCGEGQLAQGLLECREGQSNILCFSAIFPDEPQARAIDACRVDHRERLQQLAHDHVTQVGIGLDNFANEQDDVDGRSLVCIAQEVHQDRDHGGDCVRELGGRPVDGADEHRAILARRLVTVLARRLGHLLLQNLHDLGDGRRSHKIEGYVESLLPYVEVGRREGTKDVHDEFRDHLGMLLLQVLKLLENNELDVVVGL